MYQNEVVTQSNVDGLMIMDNGKHWVSVLQELRVTYDANKLAACPQEDDAWSEWCAPPLRCTFDEGLLVDFVQYPTDDRLAHHAMQCLTHEHGAVHVQRVHH